MQIFNIRPKIKEWASQQTIRLIAIVISNKYLSWEHISKHFLYRTPTDCFLHYEELRKEYDYLPFCKFSIPSERVERDSNSSQNCELSTEFPNRSSYGKDEIILKKRQRRSKMVQKLIKLAQSKKFSSWKEVAKNFPGQTPNACQLQYIYKLKLEDPFLSSSPKTYWTMEDDQKLRKMARSQSCTQEDFRREFPGRAKTSYLTRYRVLKKLDSTLPKKLYPRSLWSLDEDLKLINLVKSSEFKSWIFIAHNFINKSDFICEARYEQLRVEDPSLPAFTSEKRKKHVPWTKIENVQYIQIILDGSMNIIEIASKFKRSVYACRKHYFLLRKMNPILPPWQKKFWSENDTEKLKKLVASKKYHSWKKVAEFFNNKSSYACKKHHAFLKIIEPDLPELEGRR